MSRRRDPGRRRARTAPLAGLVPLFVACATGPGGVAGPRAADGVRPVAGADSVSTDVLRARQQPFVGRWNLTIRTPDGDRPSWLEIRPSGHRSLVGRFVGIVGSVRPVASVDVADGAFGFAIPAQWEEGPGALSIEGRREGDRLAGSITFPDGARHPWTAARAPTLRPAAESAWGESIELFNGRDLSGWRVDGANSWSVHDGVLRNARAGGNLISERRFSDYRLRVEFRYPRGGNSGVYLRGRYEVQIADPSPVVEPPELLLGAIYGFLAPSELAERDPDAWQTFEITLRGRMVTVVVNGETVICDREIPGITGGAIDSDEGAPGPILLQGDHGPVEFRRIVLTPAR